MNRVTPLQVASVDIGYDRAADRLKLVLHGETDAVGLWLTRRLTRAFLSRFSSLLERGVAREAGSGRAAVVFEHLEACGEPSAPRDSHGGDTSGQSAGDKHPAPDTGTYAMVSELNISARDQGFTFTLTDDDGQQYTLAVSRAEAHRLVSAIYRKSVAASWDLAPYVSWLAEAEQARGHGGLRAAAH